MFEVVVSQHLSDVSVIRIAFVVVFLNDVFVELFIIGLKDVELSLDEILNFLILFRLSIRDPAI